MDKDKIELPEYLYKFRCWDNEHHRRLLTHREAFFASALHFNDPFDCTIPARPDLLSDDEVIQRYRTRFGEIHAEKSEHEIDVLAKSWMEKGIYKEPEILRRYFENTQDDRYYDYGIFSTSAATDDKLLLWSHYADSHKGFCIAFATKEIEKNQERIFDEIGTSFDTLEVDYPNDYPKIKPGEDASYLKKLLSIKSEVWDYEKEYRLIMLNRSNISIQFDENIFAYVIVGCQMPKEHILQIINILRTWKMEIPLYKAIKKKDKFGLEYERILYR